MAMMTCKRALLLIM